MSTSWTPLSGVRQHMAVGALCAAVSVSFPTHVLALDHTRLMDRLADSQARKVHFAISPQPLRSALLEFSKQSGIQLIYVSERKSTFRSPSLKGEYTIRQALARLLKNSGFEYEFSEENTVTIRGQVAEKAKNDSREGALEGEDFAAEDNLHDEEPEIEEIVTLGTRAKGRTSSETAVPVDTINVRDLASVGETETGRVLQALAPSFNFSNSSISDGTDAVKPATLRGLGPDQTLVLINGKRRHQSALVHVNTSVGRGATGVDMNAIPPSAIKRIEILRDGASAQYGSDAIAGVINIVLKDQEEGGDAAVYYGQTYEGDGDIWVGNASYGFEILSKGRLTLSAEYRNKSNTNRAGPTGCLQYDTGGQVACAQDNIAIDLREASFDRQNFRIGDSDAVQKAFVANLRIPYRDSGELYMFGTYSDRDNRSAGFYRRPNQYSRTVTEIFPDGYLPLINSNIKDYSLIAGTSWRFDNGWFVDSSITTSGNSFQFVISNSLNASLGADSPISVDAGTLKISQTTLSMDLSKSYEDTIVAFGAEWRSERYHIIAGEEDSYRDGQVLNYNCPGCDVSPVPYAAGFQLFRGFSPDNRVDEKRTNLALYADIEMEFESNIILNFAARYEDYSDFGNRLNAKFAARYQISQSFALRGSYSSGFRAPSIQQRFFNSTSTHFVEINGVSVGEERGTFRNDSEVARALGIPELKEETSLNLSMGFVATPGDNLTITADYYNITIQDRIAITGSIPIDDQFPEVTAATGATNGQFFANMADTHTQGVDIVINYDVPMPVGHRLKLSLAANKTRTIIKDGSVVSPLSGVDDLVLFSPQDRSIIEDWQPSSRINFTLDYRNGPWGFVVRNNFYGPYSICEGSCDIYAGAGQNVQEISSKLLTDVQLSYLIERSGVRVTVGANNLFNVFPDANEIGQARAGSIEGIIVSSGVFRYPRRSSPFGFNGGTYYVRLSYDF